MSEESKSSSSPSSTEGEPRTLIEKVEYTPDGYDRIMVYAQGKFYTFGNKPLSKEETKSVDEGLVELKIPVTASVLKMRWFYAKKINTIFGVFITAQGAI